MSFADDPKKQELFLPQEFSSFPLEMMNSVELTWAHNAKPGRKFRFWLMSGLTDELLSR